MNTPEYNTPPFFDTDMEHLKVLEDRQAHLRGTVRYRYDRIRIHGEKQDAKEVLEEIWEILTGNREEL